MIRTPRTPHQAMSCFALLFSLSLISGCGAVSKGNSPSLQLPTLVVTPSTAEIRAGDTQLFAAVAGSPQPVSSGRSNNLRPRSGADILRPTNPGVTWSVNGIPGGNATVGTIDLKGLYTAPATIPNPNSLKVTAPNGAASRVTLDNPIPMLASVVPNTVSVGSFSLTINGSKFVKSAQVQFAGRALQTTFNSASQLTAIGTATHAQLGNAQISVTNGDPGSASSTGVLNVLVASSAVSVSTSPSNAVLQAGRTLQFTATVTGPGDRTVTWLVAGTQGGSSDLGKISSAGLYTAPQGVPPLPSVAVTARSNADPSKSGSATVVIFPPLAPVSVSISPRNTTLQTASAQQFTAAVTGTTNTGITWLVNSIQGGNTTFGSISSVGLYVAPRSVPNPPSVRIIARSEYDSSSSADTTVAITPDPAQAGFGTGSASAAPEAGRVISADSSAGTDCGAKINSADSILGSSQGMITVTTACGTAWTTAFTLAAGHNLKITEVGTYTLPKANVLSGGNDVSGSVGVVLKLASGSNDTMLRVAGSNVKVHDLTLDGNYANNTSDCTSTFACGHLLTVEGNASSAPDAVHIYNINFQNSEGEAIFWHANSGGHAPSHLTIDHNTFTNCRRDCIRGYDQSVGYHVLDNEFHGWAYDLAPNYIDAIFFFQNSLTGTYTDVQISRNSFFNGAGANKFAVEFVVLTGHPEPDGVTVADNISDCNGASGGCGFSGIMDHASLTGNVIRNSANAAVTGGTWRSGFEISGKHIVIAGNTIPTGSITVGDLNFVESTSDVAITGNHVNSTADFVHGVAASAIYLPGAAIGLTTDITVSGNDVGLSGALGTSCNGIWIGSNLGGMRRIHVTDNLVHTDNSNCSGIQISPRNFTGSTAIDVLHNTVSGFGMGYSDSGNDTTDITVARNDFSKNTKAMSATGIGIGYQIYENLP